ncbi:argininosuccinate synthase-related protein [Streptomyces caniscabiei]|uniref:argininosuccinate synthase-related protein n=1 Tax=Streptomyces caniscabiei TaxID=2746961 RepID=UPI000A3B8DD6|nr:argininosuccinate synthase-related protein [Streptomyces caniscabiei]
MNTTPTVRSFRDLDTIDLGRGLPVVTLFSGGLDSSYLLYRLTRTGYRNIHAMSVDVGDDETITEKQRIADTLGIRLHVIDARKTFAHEFVRPAISAQAVYLDTHPISSSLSRPLIARLAVELAQDLGAHTLLHTANRSQNTLRRLNGAIGLLGFTGSYGSPYELDPIGRDQKIWELKQAGLEEMAGRVVSGDSNLWCREFESGILDDPEDHAVPEHLYRWTVMTDRTTEETVEIQFRAGVPVSVDGTELHLTELIGELNRRVGAFGIGRYSGLEHLAGGEKVLEIREMPAACLLLRSYRHLETAVLEAETIREKMHVEQVWVREALEGRWFGELRVACQKFIETCAEKVDGSVRWRLTSGSTQTTAIVADHPRYLRNREDWEQRSTSVIHT